MKTGYKYVIELKSGEEVKEHTECFSGYPRDLVIMRMCKDIQDNMEEDLHIEIRVKPIDEE